MSPNARSKSTEYVRHTVAVPWCLARDDTLEQQPTLFLFQSLIAALCSNSSCLDKDSLTLRVGYESGSPTQMPVCVHCTSFAARLNKWINSHSGNIAWMDRAGQALGVPLMYPPPKDKNKTPTWICHSLLIATVILSVIKQPRESSRHRRWQLIAISSLQPPLNSHTVTF